MQVIDPEEIDVTLTLTAFQGELFSNPPEAVTTARVIQLAARVDGATPVITLFVA